MSVSLPTRPSFLSISTNPEWNHRNFSHFSSPCTKWSRTPSIFVPNLSSIASNSSNSSNIWKNSNLSFNKNSKRQVYLNNRNVDTTDSGSENKLQDLEGNKTYILPEVTEPKRIVLVRHGESTWNAEGRIQGSSNLSELTTKGINQAEISKQMLQADNFDICFYSPLERASQTAQIIWGSRSNPMVPLQNLREIDLYSFQGLVKEEGKARFGDAYRMWQMDSSNFVIDGHYPVRELWDRAMDCWITIFNHDRIEQTEEEESSKSKSNSKSILVVAHNAVIQALVATALGLECVYFRKLLQSNCGITVIDFFPKKEINLSPFIFLDRLNQTPNPPLGFGQSEKNLKKKKIILICDGKTDCLAHDKFQSPTDPLNMLGIIQSRKTAELLLDEKFEKIFCSPFLSAQKTAESIYEIQEGAECLGADCIARYVQIMKLEELKDFDWGFSKEAQISQVFPSGRWQNYFHSSFSGRHETFSEVWERVGSVWKMAMAELWPRLEPGNKAAEAEGHNVVVVSHDVILSAFICHCLGLSHTCIGSFNFNPGSVSVIEFPHGETDGVVRCLNYTSHLGRWAIPITKPSLAEDDF